MILLRRDILNGAFRYTTYRGIGLRDHGAEIRIN
jgi:hypothetical protein